MLTDFNLNQIVLYQACLALLLQLSDLKWHEINVTKSLAVFFMNTITLTMAKHKKKKKKKKKTFRYPCYPSGTCDKPSVEWLLLIASPIDCWNLV